MSLVCGHDIEVDCGEKHKKLFKCKENVLKRLACGHQMEILCQADPEQQLCTAVVFDCPKKCEYGTHTNFNKLFFSI